LEPLITTEKVSHILNVSTRTARRLAEAKVIPGARKIGRSWRFDLKKFEQWLHKLETPDAIVHTDLDEVPAYAGRMTHDDE